MRKGNFYLLPTTTVSTIMKEEQHKLYHHYHYNLHQSTTTLTISATMVRTKKIQKPNNMLWVLASLACGKNDSQSSSTLIVQRGSIPDERDDQTRRKENHAGPKEIIVQARRRRKPIKKRSLLLMNDYRMTIAATQINDVKEDSLTSTSKPMSVRILPTNHKYFINKENTNVSESGSGSKKEEIDFTMEGDDGSVQVLVCSTNGDKNEENWKKVHSALQLPSYLPCPAFALRNVRSISFKIKE
mmetsp:Transcript_41568/g.42356  ORF Transcript_41568/g.42356 Transcript_41568/m.42356 type:complete len:243 (-) Transcript_41568:215-943(-)